MMFQKNVGDAHTKGVIIQGIEYVISWERREIQVDEAKSKWITRSLLMHTISFLERKDPIVDCLQE